MVVITLFVGFLLFIFTRDFKGSAGEVKLISDNNLFRLDINNKFPLSDTAGKELKIKDLDDRIIDELEFKVLAKGEVGYVVYLLEEEDDFSINSNYVKVYLTDNVGSPLSSFKQSSVPTFAKLKVLDSYPAAKVLYYGKLKDGEEDKFKLRMWLSDSYAFTSTVKGFAAKVGVEVIS